MKEIIFSVVTGLILGIGFFFIFFSFDKMNGQGMRPTIDKDEVVLVNKRVKEYKRFDIVSLKGDGKSGLVRVIGLPGESIRYNEDYLYVNEQPVDEKFLIKKINDYNKKGMIFTEGESSNQLLQIPNIPKDHYLLLGDNRPYATDSRYYGLVPKERIKGKATMLVLPIRKIENF